MSRRAFAVAAVSGLAAGRGGAAAGGPGGGRDGTAGTAGAGRERAAVEMRGMWLATVANRDWPSRTGLSAARQRAELIAHLDRTVACRLNTVILQVRPAADALWPSPYEPWSQVLTGVQGGDPGWDPLETAVREAHARGLELHAWFNPLRVATHGDPGRLAAAHPARRRPDWVVAHGGRLYYDPGLPEVRAFVQDAMLDAVRRYPVDAVHFDDYFYPYPVPGQTFDDQRSYDAHGGGSAGRAAWRRDNIDRLVRDMAAGIRRTRPGTRFGISPFGVWRNADTDPRGSDTRSLQAYDDLYADTRTWVRENWIDYVCPQLYWLAQPLDQQVPANYSVLVPWWSSVVRGTGVQLYIGEALYKAGDPAQPAAWQDPAELSRHLTLARRHPEVSGHVYFAGADVAADRAGALARVVAEHYPGPALPPR